MTRQERLLTALRVQVPDRVPLFDFLFQQPMYEALIGRRPESYNGRDAVDCALALNHDGVWIPFGGFSGYRPMPLGENIYQDEWGTIYQKDPASWPIDAPIDYPIKTRADLRAYRPPDPTLPGRDTEIVAARTANWEQLAILGGVAGPLTTAWLLMGYENICAALYDDPELLTEVFQISNEFFKEAARRSVAAGCVGMWVSEDLGDNQRGLFRLDHYRKYVLPPFAELVDYIAGLGVPVLMHSCGCIEAFLEDLVQTKINSLHPLQRTAKMDLRSVKERYGRRLCLIGNIDSTRTLPHGRPEDVEAEARAAMDAAAPGGGFVLASDHSLHDGIPIENIRALARVGTEYGGAFYRRG